MREFDYILLSVHRQVHQEKCMLSLKLFAYPSLYRDISQALGTKSVRNIISGLQFL